MPIVSRNRQQNKRTQRRPFRSGARVEQRGPLLFGQEAGTAAGLFLAADVAHGVPIHAAARKENRCESVAMERSHRAPTCRMRGQNQSRRKGLSLLISVIKL